MPPDFTPLASLVKGFVALSGLSTFGLVGFVAWHFGYLHYVLLFLAFIVAMGIVWLGFSTLSYYWPYIRAFFTDETPY